MVDFAATGAPTLTGCGLDAGGEPQDTASSTGKKTIRLDMAA
jgi:hypothetical protein